MSSPAEIKLRLEEMGMEAKKAFGQNFLISDQVIQRIVKAARDCGAQRAIEIGPGLGALTELLKDIFPHLTLIEMDRSLIRYWQERGFEVVAGDALKIKWSDFTKAGPITLVSNLPYNISSSLLIDRSLEEDNIQHMVLMFQKEVAQRIKAKPNSKDYGLLSVVAQSFWDIELLLEAGPRDFYPPPKVASRVLVFTRKNRPEIRDRGWYLRLLKSAFAFRRKFLKKNLSSHGDVSPIFTKLGINPQARAEDLAVEQYVGLYRALRGE